MVPRTDTATRNGGTAKALTPKSTRMTKETVVGARLQKSVRVADQPPREGLLDLRQTPEHLVAIARRNAAESPLLRLPPELRNKIWMFALGGEYLRVPAPRKLQEQTSLRYSDTLKLHDEAKQKLAVFHIPATSRQSYAETATLPYSTNIFVIGSTFQQSHASSSKTPIAAYRDAVKTVAVPELSRAMIGVYGNWPYRCQLLTTHFPSLKTIEVTVTEVDWTVELHGLEKDGNLTMTRAERDDWVTACLKKKHGDYLDVKVLAGEDTRLLAQLYQAQQG